MFPVASPANILVVDDDPHNIEVISGFLQMEGFQVITATDGVEALSAVAAEAPDMILLDVVMPRLDGFETCRLLKADSKTVFIPIVLLTGLKRDSDRVKGAAVGADDFLLKPFDHLELITRVRSLVRVKRLHDAVAAHARELEQRVAERTAELQTALRQVRELDRLKSEFIANVSHELRTPLLHVKGYVDLIADGALGPFTLEQARGLRIAQQAVGQLERVVQDIVDFRMVNERELDLEAVGVADVCRNAVAALSEAASQKSVELHLDLEPNLPPVWADRPALTRVLRHLLDNAVKFSPAGRPVHIQAAQAADRVRLAVVDCGPGVPPERQEQIFDLFYQSDGSATRHNGGLGLGLAVVRVLLEAQQSAIRLESAAGQGSKFYFDLQIAPE